MKFFIKRYDFSPLKRIFVAGLSAVALMLVLLGVYISILVNAVENFETEAVIALLMNTSKLVYEKFGVGAEEKETGKSWLSFLEEEPESSGFELFGEKVKKVEPKKKKVDALGKQQAENKLKDFSVVLSEIVAEYGNPKDEAELFSKNLWGVEVILGEKLVASSDLEALNSQTTMINNIFRVKKDSTENNFVVEERKRGFFVGYDRVVKAFTFKDSDLTVGVAYIEKPPIFPIPTFVMLLVISVILSTVFLLLRFFPEKLRVYIGIGIILLVGVLVINFCIPLIDALVKEKAEKIAKISEVLFTKLGEKGIATEKEGFLDASSQNVGDIRSLRFIESDGKISTDESSLGYYLGIFKNTFTVFFVTIILCSIGVFYYFARGGLEKWLNAFYNYSVVYAFIITALLLVVVLIGIPFFFTIIMSFTSLSRYLSDLNLARQFVGFLNYQDILNFNHILSRVGFEWAREIVERSPFFVINFGSFYDVLVNTFLYTFFSVALQLVFGVTFAVILNDSKIKLRGVYQVLLILPWVIPTYISALLWREALGQYGVFKQLFDAIGLEGFDIHANSSVYFLSICFVSAWYAFPFIMIVTLSGLQGISESVKDAALIDGANWFTRLFSIYLPLIRPTLLPSVLLSSIWTFNNFNIVFLYTRGNDAYDILITRIYDFVSRPDLRVFTYGYAAAYSVLVFAILLIYILSFAKITKLTERTY
ncbi:MAG: sugar ABC transporter permease [Brevinematia bacterium]